jgi:hypothetical protein
MHQIHNECSSCAAGQVRVFYEEIGMYAFALGWLGPRLVVGFVNEDMEAHMEAAINRRTGEVSPGFVVSCPPFATPSDKKLLADAASLLLSNMSCQHLDMLEADLNDFWEVHDSTGDENVRAA